MSLLNTIASGTNSLTAGSSALSLVGSTLALVKGNQGVKGINNFLFHIPQSEELTLSAQITDHYVQDNFAGQDHVICEPLRIRLVGIIAELIYEKDRIEAYLDQVLDRLGPLGVLNPSMSQTATQYLSQYNRTKQAVTQAFDMLKKTGNQLLGKDTLNKQQEAFETLYKWFVQRSMPGYPKSAELLSVETPWHTFNNMAIETVTFSQDESTKDMSTVEVTLKQIRMLKVASRTGTLVGRAMSGAGVAQKGVAQGETDNSVLFTGGRAASR
jgi:hypothetical protein